MSRTDVTTRAAAGAAAAQRIVAAGTWLRIPSAAPGVSRVRPLPGEATASYTQRLADTYQLTLPQLLDGANITLHRHGTPPAAELHLNHTATQHLAVLTRTPLPHLTRALPRLVPTDDAHHIAAAARWKRLDAEQQPVRACALCTRHRSHGTTDTAWVHRPPHRLVCPRHHQAAPDPRLATTVRIQGVPELAAAHRAHQRLLRHPRAATAWTAARAITTRWYDHQQHLTHRWHTRLTRLCKANPHLTTTGNASPALLTRDLVTYPETVTLARALAALPNRPHRDTGKALNLIAHRLGLPRLASNANDPLRAFLTHTRH
ncbi:TniQ family protein [Streptomyces sp. NBC_00144]|uniref:TniQ family protein n=1 Tax=unclassified Streptomyces TaxID=2593676 RepID=UPI003253E744|nr:TniQ family protein [Streptomyces sp. NBC_00932]WSX71892.1 TniQ family protein [Streptomyces sp. NBC_00932]